MKHLLNNLSEEEKNEIRKQHTDSLKVVTENFKKLVKSKSGDVKLLVNEETNEGVKLTPSSVPVKKTGSTQSVQTTGTTQNTSTNQNMDSKNSFVREELQTEQASQTLTNKVAKEGLKNIIPQMISSPPFEGYFTASMFGGVFNNIKYEWDCNGVEGMSGVRGMVEGEIISETVENMSKAIQKPIQDGKPNSVCVGFSSESSWRFVVYTTTSNKPKCVYF